MTKEEFLLLYKKYLEGACTPEEEELINSWKDNIHLLDDAWEPDMGDQSQIYNNILNRLKSSTHQENKTRKLDFNIWFKAAVIVLTTTIALYFINRQFKDQQQQAYTKVNNSKILPGTNKAYLTLANGSRIILDDTHNGKVIAQSGIQLKKAKNGLVVYAFSNAKQNTNTPPLTFNTITTPRGGQYEVVLSDGTKVRLNAASSLRFPVAFTGKDRQVELTGEGYFEVAENKEKPFMVRANGTTVQDLGTHFNISAYQDDDNVTTTLTEGSVRMTRGRSNVVLKPGQQAISMNQGDAITVKPADMDETLAWLKGFFVFHNENILSVMKKVSRWYDIDVEYKGDVTSTEFGGAISKYRNIEDLLNIIKLTGTVNYKIEGRRVVIIK